MIVTFAQTYLRELYTDGKASDKQHRYQPQIIKKYAKVINLLLQEQNVQELTKMVLCITNIYTVIKRESAQ